MFNPNNRDTVLKISYVFICIDSKERLEKPNIISYEAYNLITNPV